MPAGTLQQALQCWQTVSLENAKLGRVTPISSLQDSSKFRCVERLHQNWVDQPK